MTHCLRRASHNAPPTTHNPTVFPVKQQTYQRLFLLFVILLAFALRVYQLDVQSLWYDEGVTARLAQMNAGELIRWTADDIQPPLYYLFLEGWLRIFDPWPGNIAYLMRFVSVGFGVWLVALLAILARRLWNECAARLVALITAISPLMVYYAQEARMYAMLVFLVSLAAYWLVALLENSSHRHQPSQTSNERERKRLKYLGLYAATGLAAMYTHYFAAFALLALSLYWGHVWVRENRRLRALGGFLLANLLILMGYAPWLPAMWRRFQVDASYWTGQLKIGEACLDALNNFTVGATEVFFEKAALAWLPWFGLASFIWLVGLMRLYRRKAQRPVALILHWLLLPPVLILFLAYRNPKFNPRYLLISWPAWALLMGGGIAALWQSASWPRSHPKGLHWVARSLALLTLLLVVSASAIGLTNWFTNPNFAKDAWRDAIAYMFQHRQPDEAALLVSGHAYPIFDVYLPPDAPPSWRVPRFRLPEIDILDVNQVLGWEESARALNQDLANFGGVWLFLWQDHIVDPAHVVSIQLERYAQEEPVPSFPFLGLRHFRLPTNFHIPENAPITLPGSQFADTLELVGVEPTEEGLWLYWRALRSDMPDLQVFIELTKNGQPIFRVDQRPAGYDFPTTHWNPGDTYPVWVAAPRGEHGDVLRLRVYEPETGRILGDFETSLP